MAEGTFAWREWRRRCLTEQLDTTNQRRIKMTIKIKPGLTLLFLLSCIVVYGEDITSENFTQIKAKYDGQWHYPNSALASNVYSKVHSVYRYGVQPAPWNSLFSYFLSVRGGGVQQDLYDSDMPKFLALSSFVSNHCAEIAADWRTYETNEVVRFTTLSAIGYSGYNNFTNFADIVTTRRLSDPSLCSMETVSFLLSPYGTPCDPSIGLNYDNPVVSNVILKIRRIAVMENNTNEVDACNVFLSGEWKRHHLEMKAAGAL